MLEQKVMLITGARKGIGRFLAEYYISEGYFVIGCSRGETDLVNNNYLHFCLDVVDENKVIELFISIKKKFGRLDVLLNNAGIASMNHFLLTSKTTVTKIFDTNVTGMFLFTREAAKLMKKNKFGRIVNFSTVAVALKLEGEAIYAASKAAVNSLTQISAIELSSYGITVNAIAPTPIKTDLIKNISEEKIKNLVNRLSIKRLGEFSDVLNVTNFFISPKSDYITGQIIYLGGT